MQRKSFDAITAEWEQLLAAVAANQDDLPQVEVLSVQLEAHLAALRAMQARRVGLRVQTLQATQELWDSLEWGLELVTRIRDGVRGHYGFRNDKLTEFGIRPGPKRKEVGCRPEERAEEAPRSPSARSSNE